MRGVPGCRRELRFQRRIHANRKRYQRLRRWLCFKRALRNPLCEFHRHYRASHRSPQRHRRRFSNRLHDHIDVHLSAPVEWRAISNHDRSGFLCHFSVADCSGQYVQRCGDAHVSHWSAHCAAGTIGSPTTCGVSPGTSVSEPLVNTLALNVTPRHCGPIHGHISNHNYFWNSDITAFHIHIDARARTNGILASQRRSGSGKFSSGQNI